MYKTKEKMDGSLVRVIGLLSTSKHKVSELTTWFSQYGIEVKQLDPLSDYITYLKSSTTKFKVMCILKEQTFLYKRGGNALANQTHLELVTHHSILKVYTWDSKGNEIVTDVFTELTDGYIDLTLRVEDSAKYDWDDVFVVDNLCHKSYRQLEKENIKISSRDKNVSKVIEKYVHYKKPIDLAHNPQHYDQTVDFTRSMLDYVLSVDEFNNESINNCNLKNILVTAINQGAFFRSARTRRQKLYWCPGLNAGIPFSPKPKDPKHELTYQMHDFSHFTIPDLVYDGNPYGYDEGLVKKVYIAYRLMSEAVTLVLADMIFVNNMIKSGVKYDTVYQRKIYPIFSQVEKKQPNFRDDLEPFIGKLLQGSVNYCFFKDTEIWESMMENSEPLKQFGGKYDAYFMDDFKWTLHNYEDMKHNKDVFAEWWSNVKSLRNVGANLELQSVSEFIEENMLTPELNQKLLLQRIFSSIYSKYIKRMFSGGIIELYSKEDQLKNAFVRYMMGQSIIFFKNESYPDSLRVFNKIKRTLEKNTINSELIQNVRSFYNNYLSKLEHANIITSDDRVNYEQVCPLFSPMIVNYSNDEELTEKFVNSILN
jgi:adenylate kinase